MERELKELQRGDLLYDPWYGWGLLVAIDMVQLQCQVIFYDKNEQKFMIDKEVALFLKRNINQLLKAFEATNDVEKARKYWSDMYCIF